MTRKRFWDDPYLTTLDTVVADVSGDDVTVAETILYAFSGGQESDAGTIGGRAVLAARKEGLDIVYTLDRADGLAPGDAVRQELDWPRRYALMRLHFAAELVLELATRQSPGIEKIGAHIAADKARIDFLWERSLAAALPDLADAANALIAADHPIASAFSDEAAQRRYWEIAGFARVPCGGTHLRRTGEVGPLALRRKNVGKHKER
ncbi:MAG TPA: alanyl-tRNA editing protein, partial [Herpetosiphonaceae bacterium]|nr:alanyl-tRNA editing protein [Herpetosiphonaceae bacterium]